MPEFSSILANQELNLWSLVIQAHWVVKFVMALLAAMSVIGWYIIGNKYLQIRKASQESMEFLDAFWRSSDIEKIYKTAQHLQNSPISAMFLAGYTELARLSQSERRERDADLDNVQRALHRAQLMEINKLETMVPFLATTGSAAPFIGLFGTVWGIMNSFTSMSDDTSIKSVAPGIAEALFATAIGLVAAIPAVMAYNYFTRKIKIQVSHMNTFEKDYLNIIRRHFLD